MQTSDNAAGPASRRGRGNKLALTASRGSRHDKELRVAEYYYIKFAITKLGTLIPFTRQPQNGSKTYELVRKAALEQEQHAILLDERNVKCARCGANIKLSKKMKYDPAHWNQHIGRCLSRNKSQLAAELAKNCPALTPLPSLPSPLPTSGDLSHPLTSPLPRQPYSGLDAIRLYSQAFEHVRQFTLQRYGLGEPYSSTSHLCCPSPDGPRVSPPYPESNERSTLN